MEHLMKLVPLKNSIYYYESNMSIIYNIFC